MFAALTEFLARTATKEPRGRTPARSPVRETTGTIHRAFRLT
jgi:hypothetical protein